ncbi:mechanosensitive ion channel [Rhodobacteraceae bacterium CCMM004]|nr:mechanosensitive ion channel [Rhodobacteraceae bacterium CCMM004]
MRLFLLSVLVLAALATAPAAQEQQSTQIDLGQTGEPVEGAGGIAEDAEILARIRGILIELEGYEQVDVTVRSGIVTLTGEVLDAQAMERLEELIEGIGGVVAVQNEVAETTDLSKRLNPAMERLAARLTQGVAFLPLVAVALAAAAGVIFLGILLARSRWPWDRMAPNAFIADIYRQVIRLVFVIGGIVIALDILNATALLGTILGAAGIIGLAIGFAVKDTVENFIASIMLSIRQPFMPNDAVEIEGDTGKVIRLTSRATILLSFDGNHIRIPNSTVFKSRIVNFSRNPERRFDFTIGVEAESDLAAVRDLMEETVRALPFTLDQPGISVWIQDITDSGVTFMVTGWIDQTKTSLLRARGEALRLVKQAVEAGGYAIPDTTYRIRLDGRSGLVTEVPTDDIGPVRPAPRPAPPAPPTVDDVSEAVDTADDKALEKMVEAERSDVQNPDLLRRDAPEE